MNESRLCNEMLDLSKSFDGFSLAQGEEVELVFTPPVGTEPGVIVRYEDVRAAWSIPLAYGPDCEFYVVLTDSDSEFPTPADPKRILASWRMRERTKDELGLSRPEGKIKVLPFDEPSLEITNIYPAGEDHVCEARFYFHQSRHRDLEAVTRWGAARSELRPESPPARAARSGENLTSEVLSTRLRDEGSEASDGCS